jgi:hypothetical protein
MYDTVTDQRQKGRILVSPWDHLNIRGGSIHVYRYTGDTLPNDSLSWIECNKDISYPCLFKLITSNGLKWQKNTNKVMACTDYIENTLSKYNILDNHHEISNCATLDDIYKIVRDNKNYNPVPLIVKNKCYIEKHYK